MKYEFTCPKCRKIIVKTCSMRDAHNLNVICDCGEKMIRKWSTYAVIPDDMRAENVHETSWVNSRMHTLPSGRGKAIY